MTRKLHVYCSKVVKAHVGSQSRSRNKHSNTYVIVSRCRQHSEASGRSTRNSTVNEIM